MDDKRNGDDYIRLDPHRGTYFCALCKCCVGRTKNVPVFVLERVIRDHVNGNMHRTLVIQRRAAPVERGGGYRGDVRRDDDGRDGRRRDFDNHRRDDRGGGRWADAAPPSLGHGSTRGRYGDREQRGGDGLCDAFGRIRLQDPLGTEERVNAQLNAQRSATTRIHAETKVPAETRADVQSKVETGGGGGTNCIDGIRIDHGYYVPTKCQRAAAPMRMPSETKVPAEARADFTPKVEAGGGGETDCIDDIRIDHKDYGPTKEQRVAAPMKMPSETKLPAETRADVQSKVEAGGRGPNCVDGIRIDHGYYGPTKDVRETNGWKEKENIIIKPNCIHPYGPSGGGMISAKNVNSLSLFRIDLMTGFDSVERAESLRDACHAKCSMLHTVLDKIGFRGSLVDENSNINGVRCYKVVIKKLHIASNDRYSIILEYSAEVTFSEYRMRKLLAIFSKHRSAGFLEWLGGAKGWKFDCPTTEGASWKKCAVIQLNTLQEVFKLFAIDSQKYFFEGSQRMVWRKQNELTDVVNDIRVWIETITPQSELTRKMLRNSSTGPDSLVHWAHHHPVRSCACQYHFAVVVGTTHSMSSLLGISNLEILSPSDCCIGINDVGTGGGVWY